MIIVLEISIIVVNIVLYAIFIVSCVKSSVLCRRIVITHESYDIMYVSYHIIKSYVSYDT